MLYKRGHLARPLDSVFSSATRVAVLRQLARATAPLSGRRVALHAAVNHQAAAQALDWLETAGYAKSQPSGRARVWSLDRRRWLVEKLLLPLFEAEREHADAVAAALKGALRGKCAAALLEGRSSRGELEAGQPLELVVVAPKPGCADALRELARGLAERWAVELRSRVLSLREAASDRSYELMWQLLPEEGPLAVQAVRFSSSRASSARA